MNLDFPLILVWCVGLTGVVALFDWLIFAGKRKEEHKRLPLIVDYARSFFWVFLIVLLIRSFVFQPFFVPSGSLEPTILPHEFIFVNQFSYGLRLPIFNTKFLAIGEPKRGDLVVFRFPGNKKVNYIKRVIGLPGDHIIYKNKTLYINGQQMKQTFLAKGVDYEPYGNIPAQIKQENLEGLKHKVLIQDNGPADAFDAYDVIVPKDHYFMMGDNRDGSADSRYWGFVSEKDLEGKAFFVWCSWDNQKHRIRFGRIGKVLR